jgi:fatty acid desaturase
MYTAKIAHSLDSAQTLVSCELRTDPRAAMCARLPAWLQPFLTWLTAKPAPGETARERPPEDFVTVASIQVLGGVAITWIGMLSPWPQACLLVALGLSLTTSGLGLFQVVVFHHCSHGTVFADRQTNIVVGRLISAVLLFKHFDVYKHEHMLHHSPNKLLTEEDEFADFVLGMCALRPGVAKAALWRQVLLSLVSPRFHVSFLRRRLSAALFSHDCQHNAVAVAALGGALAVGFGSGHLLAVTVGWLLPLTVLLQMATVFRILCEHRFPEPALIQARGRDFHCHATAGVFPGVMPPGRSAGSLQGLLLWAGWWAQMLAVQLPVRVLVLVGDAPCHDYHHRRPATRKWTTYIQSRQRDLEAGSPGFRTGYSETWGLFRAVDASLDSLARTPAGFLG